ncbi:MAG TPA: SCO family protein [Gaiellaceae bacterium]|jgi:cytochrome oxidase Cu insertion factor (SCO1/SenC/PrrC family)
MTDGDATGPPARARVPLRGVVLAVAAAALAGIGAGVAIHELAAHGSRGAAAATLPAFHGQASWGAGRRPAPAFALDDQNGALVGLRSLRGRSVLLTFLDSQCKEECPIQGRELGSILRRLPAAARPALVVVSVDPSGDTPASIRHAMSRWHLAGPWPWHWLNGSRAALRGVWKRYGVTVDPGSGDIVHSLVLYLIDRDGYERTAYLYPFLPAFVQGDLARLGAQA